MRPLRVEELAEILTFDFDVAEGDIPEFHADWRWKDQEQAVLSTCSSLIAIVDNNGSQVVQFSHFSVKEFLMSKRLETSTGDISRYHVLPKPAHTILARACLGFLLHLNDHTDDEASKGFPLAKYAAQHWVAHAQFEDVASHVKDGMESLFDPDKPHFAAWVRIHNIDPPLYWGSPSPSKPNPLYYSSFCGFHDLVEHLAGKHPKHLNAIGGRYQSPLLAALHGRHTRVAKLLLKHGGDVDVRGMRNQTPLHNAILWSHHAAVEAVQFLLEHGADVNARQGDLCTPLHLAADVGALEVAQILLEQNADIDSRNNKGQTPLHLVSRREISQREYNRRNLVQLLLEQGADVNARDMEHETPLHFASYCGRLEIARVLLDRGANVNMKNHRNMVPLHIVFERNCGSQDVLDLTLLLLKHGADVDARYKGHTLLHFASHHGRIETARFLLDHGANANAENKRGQKPLHLLLEGDHNSQDVLTFALLLLERGADVDAQDKDHATPLHFASYHGKLEIARVLLNHDANANAENNWGKTPLHLVLEGNHGSESQDSLALARLLLTRGADVNVRDKDHTTPLTFAAFHGKLEMVRVFLDHGANANEKNDWGQTPLHIVCNHSSEDVPDLALLLLKHGADVDAQDGCHNTPLHLASYNGRLEMVWVLLDHSANVNAEDDRGQTPLHLVSGMNHDHQAGLALARLLLRRGANANAQDTDHVTPLHMASYHGRFEIVQALLDHGANADATNDRGQTPLHLVSQGEYDVEEHGVEIAQSLLERDVDVNTQDKDQANALHLALLLGRPRIVQILLEHGAGANAEYNE